MSKLYSKQHRELQEKFDTQRMADVMENGLRHFELSEDERAFIGTRDMFFLTTIDNNGRPTVSYKGGAPGFVRVIDETSLVFPCYDGNGMYYSMGNLMNQPKAGLLFIDFETPHRLRVHGTAQIRFDDPMMDAFPEAQFMVGIAIEDIWINCPRYIHRYTKVDQSKYIPKEGAETPAPAWKRIDFVQEALPKRDQGKADRSGGLITIEDYEELVGKGEG